MFRNNEFSNKQARIFSIALCSIVLAFFAQTATSKDAKKAKAEIAYLRYTNGFWQVWLTNSLGEFHSQLTSDSVDKTRLSWSSKQKKILVNRNDGNLFVLDLKGAQKVLELPVTGMLDAQWNNRGDLITYSLSSTQITSNNDIWFIHTNGKNARKLTNNPGVSQLPSWQPKNKGVVYSASTDDGFELWRTDLKGNTEQLTVGAGFHFDPTVNAKGSLVYSANTRGNYDIWLKPVKGKLRQITEHTAYDAQPDLFTTGKKIVFYSQRGGKKRVWAKNLKKNTLTAITPSEVLSRAPIWLD